MTYCFRFPYILVVYHIWQGFICFLLIRAFCCRTHCVFDMYVTYGNCLHDFYLMPLVSLKISYYSLKLHGTKAHYVSSVWIFMLHNLSVCLYIVTVFHKL
jgi:hypothetical protein